ncbi:hypothetical protein [Kineococcus rhizosphaerae]|uniref:Uncharacterized protein n=1 Tax=Kineococcus rhizosphaerae TaxID=559628 RepID=A0A2T0QTL8_9ACTN|nr:hypothetical protein [Kineococcus rhizosphaerae]PRY08411.1 hypothetical protein CLV37_1246 [Kineococcus rhizosphaerae]
MTEHQGVEHHDLDTIEDLKAVVERVAAGTSPAVLHRGVEPVAIVVTPAWYEAAEKAMEKRQVDRDRPSRAVRMAGVVVPTAGTVVHLTPEQVKEARTERGGFTERQLAEWGVRWPAPNGWSKVITSPTGRPADAIEPWEDQES